MKYVKVNNKNTRMTSVTFWCFITKLEDVSHLFIVFIVEFEKVNVSWVMMLASSHVSRQKLIFLLCIMLKNGQTENEKNIRFVFQVN